MPRRQAVISPAPTISSFEPLDGLLQQVLQEPRSIEATRIPEEFISNLALKIVYFAGKMKGWQIAQAMRLHFSAVTDPILQELKIHHLIQVTGGSNLNRASYQYMITEKGGVRARELLERNRYVGPCPVSMEQYVTAVKLQAQNRPLVKEQHVRTAMDGLVLGQETI